METVGKNGKFALPKNNRKSIKIGKLCIAEAWSSQEGKWGDVGGLVICDRKKKKNHTEYGSWWKRAGLR